MTASYHEPVLTAEVINGLEVSEGKSYIDATLGGGGHAVEIVKRGGILLGIDTDAEALAYARQRLEQVAPPGTNKRRSWTLAQGNFRNIREIAYEHGFSGVDGVLFDLGVSSHQLDTKERGFSYRFSDAPLDLRLNQAQGESAAQLVNRIGGEELYEILATLGEEERARAISSLIVRARAIAPVQTAGDLVAIIESMNLPKPVLYGVLSRVFQALRMAVNEEIEALKDGLREATELIVPGGKIAVISFHSLEDRIVKLALRGDAWTAATKKPVVAHHQEVDRNVRARSAKLRTAQKV